MLQKILHLKNPTDLSELQGHHENIIPEHLRQKWTTGEHPSQTVLKQFQSQGWLGHSWRREKAAAYPREDCQEPERSRTKTHLAAYKPENLTGSPTEAIIRSDLSLLWHSASIIFTRAFIPLDFKRYSCSLQTIQENNINNKIQRKNICLTSHQYWYILTYFLLVLSPCLN